MSPFTSRTERSGARLTLAGESVRAISADCAAALASASASDATMNLSGDFTRGDGVAEVRGIEAVLAAGARFRVRVHEEGHRGAFAAGKLHVVRIVHGAPVHLPGA